MADDENPKAMRNAVFALLLLSLIWSYNWIVMKSVLRYIGPLDFSALRYAFGTVVLFVVLGLRKESLAPPPWRMLVLIGLSQTTGFQVLVQLALIDGGAGKTALLAYTMPFWVLPFAWWLLGDKPRAAQWLSIALAAAGLVLIIEPWRHASGILSTLLALGAGALWAFGTVLSKRVFQTSKVAPLQLTAWQMLVGTLALIVIAVAVHERAIDWSPPLIAALIYNGVLASGVAWALWLFVVQRLPAAIAGLGSLITPLLGVFFAWLLLAETPDLAEFAGIALIALALAGVLRPHRNPPLEPQR